jgi:predicted nucleotidyltransferase
MFSVDDRAALRDALIDAARRDARITGVALTGSSSTGAEDRWSDIDLAFGVAAGANRAASIAEWTERMYRDHDAIHHTDVIAGAALFRVFLLRSTLQVDLAFWPESEFGAIASTFRLVSGTARERPAFPGPSAEPLIGMGWLYALHARSCIVRGKVWQAEYMISGLRDQVLALACVRHGVPAVQGRGMDMLPREVTAPVADSLVRSLDVPELRRAFASACELLLVEIDAVDAPLAARLSAPIRELATNPAV